MHARLKINVIYFKSKEEGVKKDRSKKKKKETRNVLVGPMPKASSPCTVSRLTVASSRLSMTPWNAVSPRAQDKSQSFQDTHSKHRFNESVKTNTGIDGYRSFSFHNPAIYGTQSLSKALSTQFLQLFTVGILCTRHLSTCPGIYITTWSLTSQHHAPLMTSLLKT